MAANWVLWTMYTGANPFSMASAMVSATGVVRHW